MNDYVYGESLKCSPVSIPEPNQDTLYFIYPKRFKSLEFTNQVASIIERCKDVKSDETVHVNSMHIYRNSTSTHVIMRLSGTIRVTGIDFTSIVGDYPTIVETKEGGDWMDTLNMYYVVDEESDFTNVFRHLDDANDSDQSAVEEDS